MLVFNSSTGKVSQEQIRVPSEHEVAWIRLINLKPPEVKHVLEDLFQCHPLLVEDCIKLDQRPKMDRYKNNTLLTFYAVKPKELISQEIAIIVGINYVITVCKEDVPFLEAIAQEFQQVSERMDHTGEILYHILDHCVDEYSVVTNQLEDQVDRLERNIYRNPNIRIAQDVFRLKRTLHKLRRIFAEEKSILSSISHQNLPYTRQENDVYFIDIYDHISRVIDSMDIFRESLTGLLEMQMAMKSDRMNEIMKTLTIFSSIFLPLTFIVGLYGMNFKIIPELNWHYGYAYVWGLLVIVTIGLWFFFKRKKWL